MMLHMIEPRCLIVGDWSVSRFPAVFATEENGFFARENCFSDATASRGRDTIRR
jgi:hypothetical protein